jgi:hypothetical protein
MMLGGASADVGHWSHLHGTVPFEILTFAPPLYVLNQTTPLFPKGGYLESHNERIPVVTSSCCEAVV